MRSAAVKPILIAGLAIAAAGCTEDPAPQARAKPVVYATFYPMQYFTERIAGDAVEVVLPLPDGADPTTWRPDPEIVLEYKRAAFVVANGAGFERWLDTAALPEERLVRTAETLGAALIEQEDALRHAHGPAGEHSHAGIDGHTWLDPVNAARQAQVIRDALSARFPAHAGRFHARYEALAADFMKLDEMLREATARPGAPPVLAAHPAYDYLARRYGWNLRNLDLDPAAVPDEAVVAHIRATLEEHPARHVIWESEPAAEVEAALARQGLVSVVFSPCETLAAQRRERGENYLSVMYDNVARVRAAFVPPGS